MDFITNLPLLREPNTELYYDAIMVIVDRYIKIAIYKPTTKEIHANELADKFINKIITYFSTLKSIISN